MRSGASATLCNCSALHIMIDLEIQWKYFGNTLEILNKYYRNTMELPRKNYGKYKRKWMRSAIAILCNNSTLHIIIGQLCKIVAKCYYLHVQAKCNCNNNEHWKCTSRGTTSSLNASCPNPLPTSSAEGVSKHTLVLFWHTFLVAHQANVSLVYLIYTFSLHFSVCLLFVIVTLKL